MSINLSTIEGIIPEKYFTKLLEELPSTILLLEGTEKIIKKSSNDFVLVYPSKTTGDWLRIITNSVVDSRLYKKVLYYSSRERILYWYNSTPVEEKRRTKPSIPPL